MLCDCRLAAYIARTSAYNWMVARLPSRSKSAGGRASLGLPSSSSAPSSPRGLAGGDELLDGEADGDTAAAAGGAEGVGGAEAKSGAAAKSPRKLPLDATAATGYGDGEEGVSTDGAAAAPPPPPEDDEGVELSALKVRARASVLV